MIKFAIVTPSFNRSKYLYETAFSILTQKGDFSIEYIIQDGKSTDSETINVIKKIQSDFSNGYIPQRCKSVDFKWSSDPDLGMYHAIKAGFSKISGDYMSWLNSDDMYHPYALSTLSTVLNTYSEIQWITGIPNSYNPLGARGGFNYLPMCYSRFYISEGFYDLRYQQYGFDWIQQESTFWSSKLWEKSAGLDLHYQYAADFYLWKKFAEYEPLHKLYSFLGGYRCHGDQITGEIGKYEKELPPLSCPPKGLKILHQLLNDHPARLKDLVWSKDASSILFDTFGVDFNHLIGPIIFYNYSEHQWKQRLATILDRQFFHPC